MAKKRLNDRRLEGLKARSERYEVFDGGGLGLRVGPSGKKTWFMIYRDRSGRQRRLGLGVYPALSLAQARKAHADKLEALGLGRAIAPQGRRSMTLADLWDLYLAAHVKQRLRPRTQGQYTDSWTNHIKDALGKRRLVEIIRADVRAMHAEIGATGRTRAANLAVAVLRSMLSFAIDQELIPEPNPAAGVKLYAEKRRERFLSGEEIARLYAALETDARDRGDWQWHDLVKLLLLTGARRGNVQAMRWQDIDWQNRRWAIPGEVTKTARLYLVELPHGAVEILQRRREEAGRTHAEAVEIAAENGEDEPRPSPWVFPARSDSGHVENAKTAWGRIRKLAELPDVRLHDLRHTHASLMINSGASLAVVGAQLGHTRVETTARYAHLLRETIASTVETATAGLGADPRVIPAEIEGDVE